MKKIFTTLGILFPISALLAQPILHSDSLKTGRSFNLYSLSNVNTTNLSVSGANVIWDMSASTAVLAGTSDFLAMSSTTFAAQYPNANFAMKFTPTNGSAIYSLFNLSSTILEEVANNVGTATPVSFTNYRTALVFPFTYTLSNSDTYQKSTQNAKTITNTYDSYGTFITSATTYTNVIRNYTIDDGNTSLNWWNVSPMFPLFQASSSGFTLWKLTSSSTGLSEIQYNILFDMYPNPAKNELHIINKELISKLEIYNIEGQLQFSTINSIINISDLKPGVYFIKAFSVKGIVSQKFIKE